MIKRIVLAVLIAAVLVGGGVYAYQALITGRADEQTGPVYATAPVKRGDIAVGVSARGTLYPSQEGWVYFMPFGSFPGSMPGSFNIEEIFVSEGDTVTAGQPLLRLSAGELQNEIDKQLEDLNDYRRQLADRLGIGVDELGRINPSQGITLRASISGTVQELLVDEGDELNQGTAVARIVDDSRWRMVATVTPSEAARLRTGQPIAAKFEGFQGIVPAQIVEINRNPISVDAGTLLDCHVTQGEGGRRFVHYVTIEGDNPGLIYPGLQAELATVPEGTTLVLGQMPAQLQWLRYCAVVDGFRDEAVLRSTSEGIVTDIYVLEQQEVEAGQPIIGIAGEETRRLIEDDLERIRMAERNLNDLYAFIDQLTMRATMDGVVAQLFVRPGQSINFGETLATIYDPLKMQMFVEIDDLDVLMVQHGASVEVRLDALPDHVYHGEVTYISTSAWDPSGGATRFHVQIEVEGDPRLRPGMQAEAFIDAGRAENVLLVPIEAVFQEGRRYAVEVLNDDGSVSVVPVEIGLMSDFEVEIRDGLTEGQLVIVGSERDLLPSMEQPGSLFPVR